MPPPEGCSRYAQAYASRGLAVLPLRELDKEARERGHYCVAACDATATGGEPLIGSADPAWVAATWERRPRSNIGVVTGYRSRLLVLDVDTGRGGHAALATWRHDREAEGRVLPSHPSVRTPTGGQHRWLALPPGLHVPSSTAWLTGVDVKACGGYVAAPPSVRRVGSAYADADGSLVEDETDRAYEWESPAGTGLPLAPAWLLEDVTTRREGSGVTGGSAGGGVLPPTSEFLARGLGWFTGSRNTDAFRLACRLHARLGTSDGAREEVLAVLRRCWDTTPDQAGIDWHEVAYAASSARDRMRRARAADDELVATFLAARARRRP